MPTISMYHVICVVEVGLHVVDGVYGLFCGYFRLGLSVSDRVLEVPEMRRVLYFDDEGQRSN